MLPASYTDLIRYDGAAVQRDRRDQTVPCAIQPRDVEILADIWRYKFLTATQLLELHWPDCAPRVGRKRLTKLFHGGLLERFRPVTRTGGSFPWTYHLGHDGHRLLRSTGALDRHARFELRTIYDYRYVVHEIHLNAWILAWRRLLAPRYSPGAARLSSNPPLRPEADRCVSTTTARSGACDGPHPSRTTRRHLRNRTPRRCQPRIPDRVRPHQANRQELSQVPALRHLPVLVVARLAARAPGRPPVRAVRLPKTTSNERRSSTPPDRELTGHLWHPSDTAGHDFAGRDHILFTTEVDMHRGINVAWRVPQFPRGHPFRQAHVAPRGVRLPGGQAR
jgi:hypothetical protein